MLALFTDMASGLSKLFLSICSRGSTRSKATMVIEFQTKFIEKFSLCAVS